MTLEDLRRIVRDFLQRLSGRETGARADDLLRAAVKEMVRRRQRLLEATYVPDRYRVLLHPERLAELGPLATAVERELSAQLDKDARRRGLRLAAPVDLRLVEDAGLALAEVRAEAQFVAQVPGPETSSFAEAAEVAGAAPPAPPIQIAPPPGATATRREPRTRLLEPERQTRLRVRPWVLRLASGPHRGREIPIGSDPLTIGRGRDANIALADPEELLSRVHARLQVVGGQLLVEDLDSTNGTEIDGAHVKQATLERRARLSLGGLAFDCVPPVEAA